MAEFKLSYTANEVNEKLRKIDSLAEKNSLPKNTSDLVNDSDFITQNYVKNYAQPLGDYALKSDIPEVDLSDYALKSDLPTDYLTEIPTEYVTESELNAKGYLTSFTETDPTVPAWAKAATKPTYTASEVGALPADTAIPTVPTNVSAFTNDAGYLTEHQSLESLATQEYVDEALATKQPIGDYALKSDIPDVSSAIIDVLELPTENINENVFYRLTIAKFVENGDIVGWICYYVNELPSVGEPVSTDMVNITAYYNAQDGEVYGYADEMISVAGGVPVGWYPIGVLGQAFDVAWGGVITDTDDDDGDSVKVLLSKDYYIYQDGWCEVPFAYEKAPEFDIQWDGEIGDRFALDMSLLGYSDTYFVKVSDDVFTAEQLIGATYTQTSGYTCTITENVIDTATYPGAMAVDGGIVIAHTSDILNSALGLPAGYITNGTYFVTVVGEAYTNRLVAPSKVIKIDEKYLPDVDANSLGLHSVATSGNYNDLWNRPTIYTDVIRYNATLNLSSQQKEVARTNIDVYSKSEVNTKIIDKSIRIEKDERIITLPTVNTFGSGIAYGNGKFIITNNSSYAIYSEDGINWTIGYIAEYDAKPNVIYGNDKFLVPINYYGSLAYSIDGINWNVVKINTSSSFFIKSIAYGNNKFVAVGDKYILYSEDGINWDYKYMSSLNNEIGTIVYGDGKFIICSNPQITGDVYMGCSTDCLNWTITTLPYDRGFSEIAYGDGKFVAVQNRNDIFIYSEDGINWTQISMPSSGWQSICYGNGKFVASNNEYKAAYSIDGINWTQTSIPKNVYSICYGDGKFVAVAFDCIVYSEDGINWTDIFDAGFVLRQSNVDITSDVAQVIKPHLNLTASDVGALPVDTVIPSIEGLATETYVDSVIANLINSAPEALNTLDELAAALGDDSNFATTVTNQIASKQDAITGTAGQFVVIGEDGKPTTRAIPYAEEATF